MVILVIFCPFTPLKTPKIKILKSDKNCWRYHQKSIIWYMVPEIRNETEEIFCHFGPFFSPFTTIITGKIKNQISSFYKSVPKIIIICFAVPEIWHVKDIISFYFGSFFACLIPWKPEKSKFWKPKKKHLGILSCYTCVP